MQAMEISPVLAQIIEHAVELTVPAPPQSLKPTETPLINTDIRTVYENVQDSMRKNTSLRSLRSQLVEPDAVPVKSSLPSSTTSTLSNRKTLPFEASISMTRTYNNSDTDLSAGPALRVVNDSLNSRGKASHPIIEPDLHCPWSRSQAVKRWTRPVVMRITTTLRCAPKRIAMRSTEHHAKVDKSDEEWVSSFHGVSFKDVNGV